jgi:hypothetical protein
LDPVERPDGKPYGVIVTLFLQPSGCAPPQPASGANIRVHGNLHLNWVDDDDKSAQLRFDTVFEFEGAFTHLHSGTAQDLWTFEYLYGLRIQFIRQGAIYLDPKGGNLRRWNGIETTTGSNYSRFHGSDSFFYIGAGFQPGKRLGRIPVRIGAGVMILPGTGERIFRVTIGPQVQFSK